MSLVFIVTGLLTIFVFDDKMFLLLHDRLWLDISVI